MKRIWIGVLISLLVGCAGPAEDASPEPVQDTKAADETQATMKTEEETEPEAETETEAENDTKTQEEPITVESVTGFTQAEMEGLLAAAGTAFDGSIPHTIGEITADVVLNVPESVLPWQQEEYAISYDAAQLNRFLIPLGQSVTNIEEGTEGPLFQKDGRVYVSGLGSAVYVTAQLSDVQPDGTLSYTLIIESPDQTQNVAMTASFQDGRLLWTKSM